MQDLFIGADGGGTKTEVIIQDAQGTTLGIGLAGLGNIRTSVSQSWASVNDAIKQATQEAGIDLTQYKVHLGLGMAGTEFSSAAKAFRNTPHPYQTLVLSSDAHVACLGVHNGEDGAIITIGTGVIGYQILGSNIYRSGGYGFPHSDEGGGAWLGMELLRALFKAIDQRGPWSPILKKLYHQFNSNTKELSDYANAATPSDYAKFAPLVFEFRDIDPLAQNLSISAAKEADQIFNSLQQQSSLTDFPLALLGGIAPFIQNMTSSYLQKNLVPRKFDAPIGAIIMVKQHLGLLP